MTEQTTRQSDTLAWVNGPDVSSACSALSPRTLHEQNRRFDGTGGVSKNNCDAGFRPAYQHAETGETVESRFADGSPAPVHVLDGLPSDWIKARDAEGRVSEVFHSVIAGFVKNGEFFTREQAAEYLAVDVCA